MTTSVPTFLTADQSSTGFLMVTLQSYLNGHITLSDMSDILYARHLPELNVVMSYAVAGRDALASERKQRLDDWLQIYLSLQTKKIQPFVVWLQTNLPGLIIELQRQKELRVKAEEVKELSDKQTEFVKKLQQLVDIRTVAKEWGITESHVETRIQEREALLRELADGSDKDLMEVVVRYYTGMSRTSFFGLTLNLVRGETCRVCGEGTMVTITIPPVTSEPEVLFGFNLSHSWLKTLVWIEWGLSWLISSLCLKVVDASSLNFVSGFLFGHGYYRNEKEAEEKKEEKEEDLVARMSGMSLESSPKVKGKKKITRRHFPAGCSVEEFREMVKKGDKVEFTEGIYVRSRNFTDVFEGLVENRRGKANCTVKVLRRKEFLYVPWTKITAINGKPITITP